VRAPKVYWRDTGLAHALLGIGGERQLLEQPWIGAGFEYHVIEQIIGQAQALGDRAQPYFLRTHDGHEIDFVLEVGARASRSNADCRHSRARETLRNSRRWQTRSVRRIGSWSPGRARSSNRRR
jgi:predicted AAA+ superfamily ATPase